MQRSRKIRMVSLCLGAFIFSLIFLAACEVSFNAPLSPFIRKNLDAARGGDNSNGGDGTGVIVSPGVITVLKGDARNFTAKVNGSAGPVTWTIDEAVDPGTDIDSSGLLTVDLGEAATSFTVRARSAAGLSGTARVFTLATYTVTFNPNGGIGGGTQTVKAGETVAYPAEPAKALEFFDGWYTEAVCTNPYNFGMPVLADSTLYAKWLNSPDMVTGELGASYQPRLDVSNAGEWNTACNTISTGGNNKKYLIWVTANFDMPGLPDPSRTFGTATNIKVLIHSNTNPPKEISVSGGVDADGFQGSLLRLGGTGSFSPVNQTVVLRNIALKGRANNNRSLVYCTGASSVIIRQGAAIKDNNTVIAVGVAGGGVRVDYGGTFTMSGGVVSDNTTYNAGGGVALSNIGTGSSMSGGIIYNNTSNLGSGGGMFMDATQGTVSFTMSGGTISENNAVGGGGVFINRSSSAVVSFTMSGGVIRDNITSVNGGGVQVTYNATFTMSGGTISGNTTGGSSGAGGVSVMNGGIFEMNGGVISGNEVTGTSSPGGGGVFVGGGGGTSRFTMSGGDINRNKVIVTGGYGGGVSVGNGALFEMNGGAISGNEVTGAGSRGGGVYLGDGTFTMSGGTVFGNETIYGSLKNTATSGAALYKDSMGTAKWGPGTFTCLIGGSSSGSPGLDIALTASAQNGTLSTAP
jgi:hypothetical protein